MKPMNILIQLAERIELCESCNGTGEDDKYPGDACSNCGGQGRVLEATSFISDIENAIRVLEGRKRK